MAPRILLAQRDAVLAAAYEHHLTAEGYRVCVCATALECLQEIRQTRPDLLVLEPDLLLGGGPEVLAAIAEDRTLSSIPVLVMTSAPAAVVNEFAGGRSYALLLKPLDPGSLVAVAREVCPLAEDSESWTGRGCDGGWRQRPAPRTGARAGESVQR